MNSMMFMNHEQERIMNNEIELIEVALGNLPSHIYCQLRDDTKLHTRTDRPFTDASLHLQVGGEHYEFDIEVKLVRRKETLRQLIPYASPNRLLICNHLTPFLADFCVEHKLNFIDEAGNARVNCMGLNLWIDGKSPQQQLFNSHKMNTANKPSIGVVKLLFPILAHPHLLQYSFREIAELAGVSLGMVSKGLDYLESEKLISMGSKRRILDEAALYRLWIEYYRTTLRPKLGGIRLDLTSSWQQIALESSDYWGGEVAADELTHYLEPFELQLFTFSPIQRKIAALKVRPHPNGRLWLVPAFWGKTLDINTKAKALLATAELHASNDSRNIEVAQQIYEKYLPYYKESYR
jgi:hypothetical protein